MQALQRRPIALPAWLQAGLALHGHSENPFFFVRRGLPGAVTYSSSNLPVKDDVLYDLLE
jgi:hypothetical protein